MKGNLGGRGTGFSRNSAFKYSKDTDEENYQQ